MSLNTQFGSREICDVVFKAYTDTMVGGVEFKKGQPVTMFDTLKATTLEGTSSTVYAQGGRGNSKLVAWESDREVTFTMEDALISKLGLSVLTGAGLVDAAIDSTITVPRRETVNAECLEAGKLSVDLLSQGKVSVLNPVANMDAYAYVIKGDELIAIQEKGIVDSNVIDFAYADAEADQVYTVIVVFYQTRTSSATSVEITPDKFAGYYRIEAQTIGRRTDGVDFPMAITIPKAKVQSAFSFSFAPTGDPTSFSYTIDAFPDYPYPGATQKAFVVMDLLD